MSAVLLTGDLAVLSKFSGAGQRAGVTTATAISTDGLLSRVQESAARLAILDLSTNGLDIAGVVKSLKALTPPPTIVAFGPHVHEARLAAAADAGCDAVLTRGAFHAQMDDLLRQLA